MKNRKRNKYILLLILLLGITIGYAALSTTLKINGTTGINKNTWSVYWDNVEEVDGSVTASSPAHVNATDIEQVDFEVTLNIPGDYYEFTVDAVNNGTIDAMITGIESTINGGPVSALPSYLVYTVKYADGEEIEENHLLPKKEGNTPTTEKYRVRIEFSRSITPEQLAAMSETTPLTIRSKVIYSQATKDAIDRHSASVEFCPGCVYAYPTQTWKYATGYSGEGGTELQSSQYKTDYNEVIQESGKRFFIGMILDNNVISRAFSCGLDDNDKPFCIEGTTGTALGATQESVDQMFTENSLKLQQFTFSSGCVNQSQSNSLYCTGNDIVANANTDGGVYVYDQTHRCVVSYYNALWCGERF